MIFTMVRVKQQAVATVIGDVVGSRAAPDRQRLHERVSHALDRVNRTRAPVIPLRITVGDEYQGAFATIGEALRATLWLRVELLPEHDLRHGVGWGEVSVLQDEPRVEDGPGWWAAREAITAVESAEPRSGERGRRTALRIAGELAAARSGEQHAIEAGLTLRDEMVGALSDRSVSVLRGLLAGRTQREVAEELGISPSAVSQRVRADGLAALVAADELMGGVR